MSYMEEFSNCSGEYNAHTSTVCERQEVQSTIYVVVVIAAVTVGAVCYNISSSGDITRKMAT